MSSVIAKIFGSGKKTPAELIKSTNNQIKVLEEKKGVDEKAWQKALEKTSANLSGMKFMLYGGVDTAQPTSPENIRRLTDELFNSDLLLSLLNHITEFEFEARKDVVQIFNFVLRHRKDEARQYVLDRLGILHTLVDGYNNSNIALNCGSILREVIRHEPLCEHILNSDDFDHFFDFVQLSTFDTASDAFLTFKLMLTKHPALCARFLEDNFDAVFSKYNLLLQSRNYVTKRQSLKLLGELLLCRANFNVMIRYINDPRNLKIMMNLLRGTTKAIQFEAFHVFKIFVANPEKSRSVAEILVRNKDKLLDFLRKFQKDKEDDTFNDEKNILLNTLEAMNQEMLETLTDPVRSEGKSEGKTSSGSASSSDSKDNSGASSTDSSSATSGGSSSASGPSPSSSDNTADATP